MTSLYKRYIPPKPAAAPSISTSTAQTAVVAVPEPPKRKRERSESEILERKAKKAKKKGVAVEDLSSSQAKKKDVGVKEAQKKVPVEVVKEVEEVKEEPVEEVLEAGTVPLPDVDAVEEVAATGDFSHVKNKKKRHKLEKEARKARKAAGKGDGGLVEEKGKVESEENAEVDDGEAVVVDNDVVMDEAEPEPEVEVEVKAKKPKKKKQEEIVVEEAEDVAPEIEIDDDEAMEEVSEKPAEAEVKTKKPKKTDIVEELAPSAYDLAQSQPKKRRHKLEAALAQSPQPDDSDSDSHLRKHGAILSNFQKASRKTQAAQSHPKDSAETQPEPTQPTVSDLEMPDADLPPQPPSDEEEEGQQPVSTLPSWLAHPTIISADSKASFASLNLAPTTLSHLKSLAFEDALPVQQALLPLLLPPGTSGSSYRPGTEPVLPDLAVSAATGSGKTLAYLLPIIEGLKLTSQRGKLTALIVVPTRGLVKQVAAVAESLAKGSGLKVGTATGSGKFSEEQGRIVRKGYRYDPKPQRLEKNEQEEEEEKELLPERLEDLLECPPQHTPTYDSALDILIATPGRLLEHLEHTRGFNLVHLQWFVLDEADKLLDHQSALEISSLLTHISRPRTAIEQDAREVYLRSLGEWDERAERRVRKVLCSATMTRDIQRLSGLSLRFPKLIAVQQNQESEGKRKDGGFEVPEGLREFVVPVGDGSEKPLVALEWIRTRVFGEKKDDGAENDDGGDSSDSDSDSDSSSDSSSSDDDSDSASSSSTAGRNNKDSSSSSSDNESSLPPKTKKTLLPPTVLIFTSTSESATRLSHLLCALKPAWSPHLTVLTKARNLPRSSSSSSGPLIVISTDRAARGLDSLSGRPISHVLQYDVPGSLTGYVHRVGRTARNGREGEAWTLFSRREAGWFLKVTGAESGGEPGEGVRRIGEVERVKIFMRDEGVREAYGRVLGEMKGEVLGGGA